MKVRSSNVPWQREMERFVTYLVELSRPFLAKNGGPIIMAQIENEFAGHDPEYIQWCGDLVKRLDTSIPWVIRCYANAAENTILSCNDNDCVDFAVKHVKDRPSDPLVWTEDEGWFQTWAKNKKNPLPNDQRTAQDMAYAVSRWFAVGGAAHNYYVAASAGVTTMYADGVNLRSDGLSNEPKRTHLRKLHEALIECNDILMLNERQLLNPHDLTPAGRQSVGTLSQQQQRAFVYGPGEGPNQVAFLENQASKTVTVVFKDKKYELSPYSMMIIKDNIILFDTADVQKSFPGKVHRTYAPIVQANSLQWATWNELNVSRYTPRKRVVGEQPGEQLRLTADRSDYLTYETTFTVRSSEIVSEVVGGVPEVTMTSCEASSIIAFVDGWLIGERNLAYPGGNCSKEFRFHLPVNIDLGREHSLKLVSVSLGIYSLGSNHTKGLTGAVRIGRKDLREGHQWEMYPSLVGEQLEIYRPQWLSSVPWTPVPRESGIGSGRQLMSWYWTSFTYPTFELSAETDPNQSSILLDFIGLTRGRAYINGHDLGRFWLINDEGNFVQRYYHVPRDWLVKDQANVLVVFDELGGSVADVRMVSSWMVPNVTAAAVSSSAPVVDFLEKDSAATDEIVSIARE
ncbi:unnamed protein product [Phytophthora fragariaefolia]|uniref:Beta-galactosidase n=1 Tax=Phytophthora fragariaefolia TaxID=1490495 RepID=A0A9W6Y8C9_9STRA|nr:unnamed protein product [Phytophthora fragariaefolia]